MSECVLATMTVEQLLSTQNCDCDSHRVSDNRYGCQHCGADARTICRDGCPVGELDNRRDQEMAKVWGIRQ